MYKYDGQEWAVPVKCTAPGMYMYIVTAELDKYNCTVPKNVQIGLNSAAVQVNCTAQGCNNTPIV